MTVVDALRAAVEKRKQMLMAFGEKTTAYRLVHSGADGFDGLSVDRLGDYLLVEQHRHEAETDELVAALTSMYPGAPIYLKHRWSRKSEERCGMQVAGPSAVPNFEVLENGLRFGVRLLDEEHVGFFLDSRLAREWVGAHSAEKRVLNLFSYTGGFGVYGVKGGAKSTVNIDNKNSALQYARYNYERNGLPFDNRTFFKCDVLYYLKRAAAQDGRFDLIVVDPPPRFKRRKRRDFLAHVDYGKLLALCVVVLAPTGGIILAGLNALKAGDDQMSVMIAQAAESTGFGIEELQQLSAHCDFPPTLDRPTARFRVLQVSE